jgi:hypothetical protein
LGLKGNATEIGIGIVGKPVDEGDEILCGLDEPDGEELWAQYYSSD